jgi:RND family efflux transporter MFP subunit
MGTPALVVVNVDQLEVEASLTESDIGSVQTGQAVQVKLSAAGQLMLPGTISRISPIAGEQSRTYPIWVSLENTERAIRPGMFAEIQLTTENRSDVLAVPTELIQERDGLPFILVAEGNKVTERKVKIGISDGKRIEILEGLSEGDLLISGELKNLSAGMDISIKETELVQASGS